MPQIAPNISLQNDQLTIDGDTINCDDVRAIKFCYEPIRLEFWPIGTKYSFGFVTEDIHIVTSFKCWLGINAKRQHARYKELINGVWDSIVIRLYHELVHLVEDGHSAPVGPCTITPAGIIYSGFLITWDDLSFQVNYNRLTISSKSNPAIWTNLYYNEVYNVYPLRYFLEWKFRVKEGS